MSELIKSTLEHKRPLAHWVIEGPQLDEKTDLIDYLWLTGGAQANSIRQLRKVAVETKNLLFLALDKINSPCPACEDMAIISLAVMILKIKTAFLKLRTR